MANSQPVIKANVTDQNGTDVSSAFQIMVYRPAKAVATSGRNGRADENPFGTPLNACHTRKGATFLSSTCNRKGLHGASGSMQSYSIVCKDSDISSHLDPGTFVETGKCTDNEVCVDEQVQGKQRPALAFCISMSSFARADEQETFYGMELGSSNLSVAVSRADGKTPFEMQSLEVDAIDISGSSKQNLTVKEGMCQDCVSINTEELPPKVGQVTTNALMAYNVIMETAILGVIWMCFATG